MGIDRFSGVWYNIGTAEKGNRKGVIVRYTFGIFIRNTDTSEYQGYIDIPNDAQAALLRMTLKELGAEVIETRQGKHVTDNLVYIDEEQDA